MTILKRLAALELEAADYGFKWETPNQIMTQIESECVEIHEHLNNPEQRDKLQEEIGDLLHAVFSLCVFSKFDPETTLLNSINKFERRLRAVKQITHEQGLNSLNGHSFDELMAIWNQAKKRDTSGQDLP